MRSHLHTAIAAAGRFAASVVAPSLVLGAAYHHFLAQRSDYLGHYLAGYGGTLAALSVVVALSYSAMRQHAARWLASIVAMVTIASIGLGVATEATIFRLARFDEIDLANQSIGAVLAGLGFLYALASDACSSIPDAGAARPAQVDFRSQALCGAALVYGLIMLERGYHYAFL